MICMDLEENQMNHPPKTGAHFNQASLQTTGRIMDSPLEISSFTYMRSISRFSI